LQAKHPEKFNGRGEGKWRGVLYGASLQGLRLGEAIIYRGTYATGLFQCIYQPGPAHWAMLPGTLEWHFAAALAAVAGVIWPGMLFIAAGMLGLSIFVAILQGIQARLSHKHDGFVSRLVVMGLCYGQPLVRSWARYRARIFAPAVVPPYLPSVEPGEVRVPWTGSGDLAYWTEEYRDRTELLGLVVKRLEKLRWPKVIDAGWSDWDLEVLRHVWTAVQICTTQEDHGGKKRLIRVRYRVKLRGLAKLVFATGLALTIGVMPANIIIAGVSAAGLLVAFGAMWWRAVRAAAQMLGVVNEVGSEMRLIPCPEVNGNRA